MKHTVSQANHALLVPQPMRPLAVLDGVTPRPDEIARVLLRDSSFLSTKDRKLLLSCPTPGGGVHAWTFCVLLMLSRHYTCEDKLFQAAREIFTRFASREVPDGEIRGQIPNVLRPVSSVSDVRIRNGSPGKSSNQKWPLADVEKIEDILAKERVTLSVLRAKSPVDLGEFVPSASSILEALFPGDPLLCCGQANYNVVTRPRSAWNRFDRLQFIVPSPMSKATGLNKAGKRSHRCLDNTAPRRFLVVEFDFKADVEACESSIATRQTLSGPSAEQLNALEKAKFVKLCLDGGLLVQDICAALIDHLSTWVKPALVVHSGGKSLHSWFYCHGEDEADLRRFMNYAVSLGADPATWTRCQLVRMPGGTRYADATPVCQQAVCYFDPGVIEV